MLERPLNVLIIKIEDLLNAWDDMKNKEKVHLATLENDDDSIKWAYKEARFKVEETGEAFLHVCPLFDKVLFTQPIPVELQKEKFFKDFVSHIALQDRTLPFTEERPPETYVSAAFLEKDNYCTASVAQSVEIIPSLNCPHIRVSLDESVRKEHIECGNYYDQQIFQGLKNRVATPDILQGVMGDLNNEKARLYNKELLASNKGDQKKMGDYQRRQLVINNAINKINSKENITYREVREIIKDAAKKSFSTGNWLSRLLGIYSTGTHHLRRVSNNFFFKPETNVANPNQLSPSTAPSPPPGPYAKK